MAREKSTICYCLMFGRVLTCLQKRTENGAIATQSQRIHSHLWIKLQLLLKKTLLLHELKTRPTLASGLLSISAIFYPLMHGKFAKSVFCNSWIFLIITVLSSLYWESSRVILGIWWGFPMGKLKFWSYQHGFPKFWHNSQLKISC